MTKGQIRAIRKNWRVIKSELDLHAGTDAEYAKVTYDGDWFVVHRSDFDRAMRYDTKA